MTVVLGDAAVPIVDARAHFQVAAHLPTASRLTSQPPPGFGTT